MIARAVPLMLTGTPSAQMLACAESVLCGIGPAEVFTRIDWGATLEQAPKQYKAVLEREVKKDKAKAKAKGR